MYTANTLASAIEAMGMTIPGSSSFPAESKEKHDECASVGPVMYNLLAKNILPRQIMTRSAFENAMVRILVYSIRQTKANEYPFLFLFPDRLPRLIFLFVPASVFASVFHFGFDLRLVY